MAVGDDVETPEVLVQKAIYWAVSGANSDTGESQAFADPVEIDCRWVDQTMTVQTKDGDTRQVTSYLLVDRDLLRDSVVKLGRLASITAAERATPLRLEDTFVVRKFNKIPNGDGDAFVRKAFVS